MILKSKKTYRSNSRSGGVVVEAALLLPFLIIVNFGAIDVAQFINSAQVVSNASREGGRMASKSTTSSVEEVESAVREFMYDAIPALAENVNAISITVFDANGDTISEGELSQVLSGAPVSVKIDLDFDAIRWLTFVRVGDCSTTSHCRRQ